MAESRGLASGECVRATASAEARVGLASSAKRAVVASSAICDDTDPESAHRTGARHVTERTPHGTNLFIHRPAGNIIITINLRKVLCSYRMCVCMHRYPFRSSGVVCFWQSRVQLAKPPNLLNRMDC